MKLKPAKRRKNRRPLKEILTRWLEILLLAVPFFALLAAYHFWRGWFWIALMWVYFAVILGLSVWIAAQPWDEMDALMREEDRRGRGRRQ